MSEGWSDFSFVASSARGEFSVRERPRMTEVFFAEPGKGRRSELQVYGFNHRKKAEFLIEALANWHGQ